MHVRHIDTISNPDSPGGERPVSAVLHFECGAVPDGEDGERISKRILELRDVEVSQGVFQPRARGGMRHRWLVQSKA